MQDNACKSHLNVTREARGIAFSLWVEQGCSFLLAVADKKTNVGKEFSPRLKQAVK